MSTLFNTFYMKINEISPQDNKYLQIINNIALMPKKLYYIGTLPAERRPTVAIVGTRKPTTYGRDVTEHLAYELAKRGVVVVSGLALGVDAIGHRAALKAGGTTIAVLANGLSQIRPMTNRQLGEDMIANGGAIISEYAPEEPPYLNRFLERNRIVSGISDAVLITEASSRSGTLNTAKNALEQGKDVFVVPGNITSPSSAGCNALLKQGAIPVTEVDDILARIAPVLNTNQTQLPLGTNPLQTKIIKLLQSGVRDGDQLQEKLALPVHEISGELTMMEIEGTIRALGANQWTLR